MRIIPAIDILNGRCVRLTQGDYNSSKIYDGDPVELARRYEGDGFRYLHLVDLDGAKAGKVMHLSLLERIASATSLRVDFGGGIKSTGDARSVMDAGAAQFTAGSIAVREPETVARWLEEFGHQRVILGADAREGLIAISGWQQQTGEDIRDFVLRYLAKGIRYVLSTDIASDGMLQGPSLELYNKLLAAAAEAGYHKNDSICLIASGGVHRMEDIAALRETGCEAVVVGKALLEGHLKADQLAEISD